MRGEQGEGYSREELTSVCLVGKANLGSRHPCHLGPGVQGIVLQSRGVLESCRRSCCSCLLGSDSPSSASAMLQGCTQPGPSPHQAPTLPPRAPSTLHSPAAPCAALETWHVPFARVLQGDGSPSYLCTTLTGAGTMHSPKSPTCTHRAAPRCKTPALLQPYGMWAMEREATLP